MWRDIRRWWRGLRREISSIGRGTALVLLWIVLVGAFLRISYLDVWLTSDEATTLGIALRPFHELIAAYDIPNNHILNTVLIHGMLYHVDFSLSALRLPVLIAGILLIPITFLALRRWYPASKAVAIVGTIFISLHPMLIYYSVIARGYMLQTLWMMLLICLMPMVARRFNRFDSLLWVIFTALAFWTLPTSLYFYVGIFLWIAGKIYFHWGGTRRKVLLWRFFVVNVAAVLVVVLLYSPVIFQYGLQALIANDFVASQTWNYFQLLITLYLPEYLTYWGLPNHLLFFAVGLGVSVWAQRAWRQDVSLPLLLLVVFVGMSLIQRNLPPFRVTTYLIPTFCWLAALFIVRLLARPLQRYPVMLALFAVAGMGMVVLIFPRNLANDPYPEVFTELSTRLQPQDVVLTNILETDVLHGYLQLERATTVRLIGSNTDLREELPYLQHVYFLTTDWRVSASASALIQQTFGVPLEALPPPQWIGAYPREAIDPSIQLAVWDAAEIAAALR